MSAPAPTCRGRAVLALLLLLLLLPLAALATPIKPGHAGHWSDPERDGEGWVLELLDADSALLYWFTYDEAGNQRWLTAVGTVQSDADGERLAFPALVATRGARFGPEFDPDHVVREVVGSGLLRFEGCDRARFEFQAYGQSLSIPLQRLAHLMGSACERPHGMTGRPAAAHAGLSGSWYDLARSGEGYALQWINPEQAILTWYTYDTAGRQYWLIGEGRFDGEGRIVAQMHATHGGRFGAAFEPDQVERLPWGEVVLAIGCDGGTGDYASTVAGFGQGRQQLQRLTGLHRLGCPWQAPKLTDLYDIELVELPTTIGDLGPPYGGTSMTSIKHQSSRVNDAGAVWSIGVVGPLGSSASRAIALPPGAGAWHSLGTTISLGNLRVAAQGEVIVAHAATVSSTSAPRRWQNDEWQLYPTAAALGPDVYVNGLSADGRNFLIGRGGAPVLWSEATGTQELPVGAYGSVRAMLVGNDSRPVVGQVSRGAFPSFSTDYVALIWHDLRRSPERLLGPPRDPADPDSGRWQLLDPKACSSDCGVIFGDRARSDTPQPLPERKEPWYVLENGASGFLGLLDDIPVYQYWIEGTSNDGSLVVGWAYSALPDLRKEGFVWTQHTGMVSMRTLLTQLGVPPESMTGLEFNAVSPDGHRVLGWFYGLAPATGASRVQPVMLTLVEKGPDGGTTP